jgi:oligosaccharyltransferase complex subunit delta (ribophorin II)
MRLQLLSSLVVLYTATLGSAASSWGFDDATISVQGKGTGVGGGLKEK